MRDEVAALVVLSADPLSESGNLLEALRKAGLLDKEPWVLPGDVPPSHRDAMAGLSARGQEKPSLSSVLSSLPRFTPLKPEDPRPVVFIYFRIKPPHALTGTLKASFEKRFGPVTQTAAPPLGVELLDPYQAWFAVDLADVRGEQLLRTTAGMGLRTATRFPAVRELVPGGHLDPGGARGALEIRTVPHTAPYLAAALEWSGAPVDRTFLTWRD
jgi:hypothetical protein